MENNPHMRNFPIFVAVLLMGISLFFFTEKSFAAEPIILSLQETILLALRDNPSVQSAEVQRVVDKINLQVAEWGYQLHYGFTGSTIYTRDVAPGIKTENNTVTVAPGVSLLTPIGTNVAVQFANSRTHTVGFPSSYNPAVTFSLNQPLLQGFGPRIALAPLYQARNQEILNKLNLKNTVMDIVTNVIAQYAALAQAQNSITAQKLSLKNSVETLKQQEAFLKIGRIAPADLVQFQANVASQQLSLEQQQVNLQQQQSALLTSLGIDPSTPIQVSDKIIFANETLPCLAESIRLGLANNIAYQSELVALRQAKIALDLATDKKRPTLNLSATRTQNVGIGANNNTTGLGFITNGLDTNTTVGLNLSVPIDDLSLKQAYIQAKIALQQEYIRVATQKRQVVINVTNAYNTVINQKGQIKQAEFAVRLAQQSLNIANAKLKYGRATAFEVSTLQTNLITQQLTEINTVSAYFTNLALLDQTTGTELERWNIQLKY